MISSGPVRATVRSALLLPALAASALLASGGCSADDPADPAPPPEQPDPDEPGADPGASRNEVIFARVYYKDVDDLQRIADELDALEEADRQAGWVGVLLSPEQYDELIAGGYRIDVMGRDRTGLRAINNYPCYRTVEETRAAMLAIASDHPTLATVVDIGDSWDKVTPNTPAGADRPGYDLLVLKLTNRAIAGPKPAFFLMGAIHAREYTTAETAMRFAEQIVSGYGTDPDATWLLDHHELHVLPHTNPDGRKLAEQGYYQRKNRDPVGATSCANPPTSSNQYGVDLNRNYAFKFGGASTSTSKCNTVYRGPSANSEPETTAVTSYLASLFPDQRGPLDTDPAPATATGLLITLHSYAGLVLYPWGWTTAAPPNAAGLATLGRKFGFHNGYGVCQPGTCLYAASGVTEDWVYGTLGVPGYTFEMGTAFFQSCSSFTGTVLPPNLAALRYGFKAARRPYQTPSGPESLSVAVSASPVAAGTTVTLTATANDTRYNSGGYGTEPTQNIAAARYSVDGVSWAAGATLVPMTAADGAFNAKTEGVRATINTAGWSPGRHIILVESQDTSGNWGVPSAVFLDIQ
ncbi:MAG TPA: M14 family zinc carboxypeptidase [Kofleriaceae bacterium]|nr:M14 family zinc carboxypeptidase [Kofleriaceae bacterium]